MLLRTRVGQAYTLSTLQTAARGMAAKPPPPGHFPEEYADDFDDCELNAMPRFVAPMSGAFECANASGARAGISVRQRSGAMSICDRGDVLPYAILGDGFRTTYNVTADVFLPPSEPSAGAFVG